MQLAMHMQMLDTLKVFSRYASPQLDQVIEDAEQTTEEHLSRAKELIKDHEGKDGKGKSSVSSDKSFSSPDRSSNREARRDRDSSRD